ncbi:MAG: GHKL domain-containing protein [Bacteriovorax sp.]|nr:GHKL domain-containing protein [Bacteriovorax sp.]
MSYKSEMHSAKVQSSNLTEVLEGQISTSFKKIDLILMELQDQFSIDQVLTPKKSYTYNKLLLNHKNRLPEVLSIKAVDQDGEFIGDDLGFLAKSNLRDREYFQYLKNSNKDELKISRPVISKTTGKWVMVLARPILSKVGKFRGLILATIPLDFYREMFSAINIGPKGVITLYGFDHFVYARIPWSDEHFGKVIKLAPQIDDLVNGSNHSTSYLSSSRIDNVERIVTGRKIGNYHFTVLVGLAVKDFLYAWKLRTFIYIILILVLFSGFAFFLLNFLHSLELVEEQRKLAIQSAKLSSLGEMASGIAHEINNPLTIISALAMTIKRPTSEIESDKKLNDSLDKIIKTVDRIAKIIKGLRTFARDSFNDPAVAISIKHIIDSILDLCGERLKNNGIALRIIPFQDLIIECREVQIVQVIMNLLNNSLDALEDTNGKWIEIKITDMGDRVTIAISDSGKKIPEAIIQKMMQPFFTTKAVGKGTGLGLSISKGIIESHNGRFTIDSNAIHTTFIIELPKKSD